MSKADYKQFKEVSSSLTPAVPLVKLDDYQRNFDKIALKRDYPVSKQKGKGTNVESKTSNKIIRYRKGHFDFKKENMDRTKMSADVPEWFNVVTADKLERKKEALQQEGTITIFSRNQNWITVDANNPNRKHPLEKEKKNKMETSSVIMPRWMQIIPIKTTKENPKFFKREHFISKGQNKDTRVVMLNDELPNKSIFSYMDFRHNLTTREEADKFGKMVSQVPKQLIGWECSTKFDPKVPQDTMYPRKYIKYRK